MSDELGTLGTYVRARREAAGISQTELAARVGINKSQLSGLEHGKIKLPGVETRRRLAAALGVRHVDLLIAAGELLPEEVPGPVLPAEADAWTARLVAQVRRIAWTDETARIISGAMRMVEDFSPATGSSPRSEPPQSHGASE